MSNRIALETTNISRKLKTLNISFYYPSSILHHLQQSKTNRYSSSSMVQKNNSPMAKSNKNQNTNTKRRRAEEDDQIEASCKKTHSQLNDENIEEEEEENCDNVERTLAKIDSDFLDCNVCSNPLQPPLYQCMHGHTVCFSCLPNLKHKCPVCTFELFLRNFTLEKLVSSIQVQCKYSERGCLKFVSYPMKEIHEQKCRFGPSSCPIPNCADRVLSGKLFEHFQFDHKFPHRNFEFNKSFSFKVNISEHYIALSGPNTCPLLIVNKSIDNIGQGIALYYLDPDNTGLHQFACELAVVTGTDAGKRVVQGKTQVSDIKEWSRDELGGFTLLVPSEFCKSGLVNLTVLIRKKDG